ncbi:MAG: hypothetical protein R2681_00255 [Pyrinomonadaceae bacterium]
MTNSYINPFRKLAVLFALLFVLAGDFSTLAQTRTSKVSGLKCSGAWTGVVKYTRTQSQSDNKTVDRVSGRGKDTRNWEMKYDYKANVSVVESPEQNGDSIGKASISHSFSSIEKNSAVERNSCDQGKTWRDMSGTFTSETKTSGSGNEEANVTVSINSDGTYAVSVGIPQIKGQTTGSQTSSFSGQCTTKEGKNLTMPPTQTTIEGNRLSSDGSHRLNPDDPNRISGSYTFTQLGVTETISWTLQKCGAPLRLVELKFEDMKFPNWNEWKEIVSQRGTIDGNLVKIKAKILNASGETKYADLKFKETYKGDKWDGARPDGLLPNGETSVRIDAGEEKEVELMWDSSGYAWFDDGRPRMLQRIKAELEENGKKVDEMTENLKVAPKPVVLVHGLWSNWRAWEPWQNILTTSHSYDWKAFPVGEKAEKGVMNTGGEFMSSAPTNSIFENSQELGKYIRYTQEDRNAWHVDIVAHSMGGLISRHYIHQFMPPNYQDGKPQIAHLVMLGTPNMGSPCADVMNFAFEMTGKNVEAVRQLTPSVLEEFNRVNVNRKGVKFSVLAGNPLPVMCKTVVRNDGVVPVPSAIWKIKDNALSKNIHTDLTGTADFSNFVKPRLAIGPKGDHMPEAPDFSGRTGQSRPASANSYFVQAAYRPQTISGSSADEADLRPDLAKAVKLAALEKLEIEIPVEEVLDLGLTFMASPEISATLFNEKGVVVGKNLAKTPEANAWFRSLFVDKNITAGTWKLRLENTSKNELEVVVAVWSNTVK